MRAGDQDLRASGGSLNFDHVDLDAVAGLELLALDLLIFIEHGIGLAQIDQIGLALLSLDDAGDHGLQAVAVLIVDHIAFFFADALKDHVLRVLGRDAAEGLGIDLDRDDVAGLRFRISLPGLGDRDLQRGVQDILLGLHDLLLRSHAVIAGLRIDGHVDVVVLSEIRLAGLHQGLLNRIQKGRLADAFFLLQDLDCFLQLVIHDYLPGARCAVFPLIFQMSAGSRRCLPGRRKAVLPPSQGSRSFPLSPRGSR